VNLRPLQNPAPSLQRQTVIYSVASMACNLQSCISPLPRWQTCHHAPIRLRATHPELPQNALHPRTSSTVEHLSPVHESLAPSDDLLTVFSRQWVRIMRGLIRGLSSCGRWGEKGEPAGWREQCLPHVSPLNCGKKERSDSPTGCIRFPLRGSCCSNNVSLWQTQKTFSLLCFCLCLWMCAKRCPWPLSSESMVWSIANKYVLCFLLPWINDV